jgi:hypothetical protein
MPPTSEASVTFAKSIQDAEDGTSQIDHVVVSRFGVFVVETKNLLGVSDALRPGRRAAERTSAAVPGGTTPSSMRFE